MQADLILTNGNVITMDDDRPRAGAVAVWRGLIVAVGDEAEARRYEGPGTRRIDLAGQTVLPGLIEGHAHPCAYGQALRELDLRAVTAPSIAAILAAVAERAERTPDGGWIAGRGYDDTKLAERRHPTRRELDRIAPHHPVYLTRTCGHLAVANSAALALVGYGRDTPDPVGGRLGRDERGELTGLVAENAMLLFRALARDLTPEAAREDIRRAARAYLALGVTSWQDAGSRGPVDLHAYQELAREGALPVRTYAMVRPEERWLIGAAGLSHGLSIGDRFTVGPSKLFMDGSGGGRTAGVFEPYRDEPDNFGITNMPQEELDAAVLEGAREGWQIAVHAIGDRAITMVLDAYERALARHPRPDHRWRIEHCGLMNAERLGRMRRLGVLAAPQPTFITELGDSYIVAFGHDRLTCTYPLKSFFDWGIVASGSSDAPVCSPDPRVGLYAAVTRRTERGDTYAPDERITIEQALRMYTINAAYTAFEEGRKGSIAPGKLADFTVLGADPTAIAPDELLTLPVNMTIVGGEVAYEA